MVSSDSSAKSMEAWKCICASLSCVNRCGNLTEVSLPSTLFSTGEEIRVLALVVVGAA